MTRFLFRDRQDAGAQLGSQMPAVPGPDLLVLGLARGGVVVAAEVARCLGAELDVLVVRKVGAPTQPEFGVGAVAPGGVRVVESASVRGMDIGAGELERRIAQEEEEVERRARLFRRNRPPLAARGRSVLLVDDGLATGVSALAAIACLRQSSHASLHFAVPVASPIAVEAIRPKVDSFHALHVPADFHAVGEFYEDFGQTSEGEVIAALDEANARRAAD